MTDLTSPKNQKHIEIARQKVFSTRPDTLLSASFCKTDQLGPYLAIHAFFQDVRYSILIIQDVSRSRQKLSWWAEEIQRASKGVAEHPYTQVIQQSHPENKFWTAMLEYLKAAFDIREYGHEPLSLEQLAMSLTEKEYLLEDHLFSGKVNSCLSQTQCLMLEVESIVPLWESRQGSEHWFVEWRKQSLSLFSAEQLAHKMEEFYQDRQEQFDLQSFSSITPSIVRYHLALFRLKKIASAGEKVLNQPYKHHRMASLWTAWRTARRCKRR